MTELLLIITRGGPRCRVANCHHQHSPCDSPDTASNGLGTLTFSPPHVHLCLLFTWWYLLWNRRNNASNESSPLVSSGAVPRSKKGSTSSLRLATAGAAFVVAVALIVQGILHHLISTKPVTIAPQEPQVKQSFRPYCETYGRTTARIIQTSLAQPSQQWNPLPCYSTDPEKGLFGRPKKAVVDEYQVPDAVLQVDFDTPALANRSVPILGFGGAFTEAAALNYHSLSKTGKKDSHGITLWRIWLGIQSWSSPH